MGLTDVKDPRAWPVIQTSVWSYHPDLLVRAVPRYTSYPTAAEFKDDIGEADLQQAIETLPEGTDVSLYVHIPFCERICWYCGCNTARANRRQRVSTYLGALSAEIGQVGALLAKRGARVTRIAFGGGSPNAIRPYEFIRLLYEITVAFNAPAAQISVEIDPRSYSADWTTAFAGAGITHASLGVQTFSPRLQAAIGRVQGSALIEACTQSLRQAGIGSINFDLMYGLPGQTLQDLSETLDAAIHLRPERVALFGYAHVPGLLPRQRRIDASALPAADMRFRMAELGYRRMLAAGYEPVGFDHFSLPGDGLAEAARSGTLHRNFQGFTDDQAEILIGLGASAISQFPHLLVQNEKNSGRYRMRVSAGRFAACRGIRRDAQDQWRGAVIEDILCRGQADLAVLPLSPGEREGLRPFLERGLATMRRGHLCLEPGGLPYARTIAAILDPYRNLTQRRFSSAV